MTEDIEPKRSHDLEPNGWLQCQEERPPDRGSGCKANGELPVIKEPERQGTFDPYKGKPTRPGERR